MSLDRAPLAPPRCPAQAPAPRVPARVSLLVAAVAVAVAGCASRPNQAPVEDRSLPRGTAGSPTRPAPKPPAPAPAPAAVPAPAPAPAPARPGADPAITRPAGADTPVPAGYYAVRPGDTLGRIALDHGQGWRDLARWNGIENPNLIEVGQLLRVVPPGSEPGAAVTRPVPPVGRAETRPVPPTGSAAGAPAPAPPATPPSASAPASPPPAPAPAPARAGSPREGDEDVAWGWPAAGPVQAGFDEARSVKGLSIGGKPGDAVLAAADGRVVYAGNGLRGYGNLVIVKHNDTYLTAYAHNQALLVKEDQVVRRGQKIAEMGSSDSDSVRLHFEVRRLGRPVDPARLLPPR